MTIRGVAASSQMRMVLRTPACGNVIRCHLRADYPGSREACQVPSDEDWLLEQGFRVEVHVEEGDIYWADPVNKTSPSGRVPRYGRGATPDAAISSAKRRYETEQLGLA
jgi:hypothetical protein